MNEGSQGERALLKKELCNYIEANITDLNIRQYIFGGIENKENIAAVIRKRPIEKYPIYIGNVFSLAFVFLYACYRRGMRGKKQTTWSNHNAQRVINSMHDAFVKYPVTQELIQFVLTDVQFELALGENSELRDMFGWLTSHDKSLLNFNPYFNLIANYKKAPGRFTHSKTETLRMFINLLKQLTFLSDYSLVVKGVETVEFVAKSRTVIDEKYATLPLKHVLFRDDEHYTDGFYRLFSIEKRENPDETTEDMLTLRYLNIEEDSSRTFTVPSAENDTNHLTGRLFKQICSESVGYIPWGDQSDTAAQKKTANKIDQIHAINYKYIKNLALAISDSLSGKAECKKHLYNRFHDTYPYIFMRNAGVTDTEEQCTRPYESKNLDWDSIVVMLLIEASPSVVLEFIIRQDTDTMLVSIAKNLYKRVYDRENLKLFSQSQEIIKQAVRDIITKKLIVGEARGFGKIPSSDNTEEKLFPRAAAMLILSKLTALQEETDRKENLIYTGNLRNNINLLQSKDLCEESAKRVRYACIILGETIKHLMCFYSGVFAYGKKMKEIENEYFGKSMTENDFKEQKKSLDTVFLDAAKAQAKQLKDISVVEPASLFGLMDMFEKFCEVCQKANRELPEKTRNLYTAVGKYELINARILRKLFGELRCCGTDLFDCDAEAWVKATLVILEYFKTGSMPDTPKDSNLFNAIYPFTAVFNRGKENPDGYRTVNFSLNIDIDEVNTSDYHSVVNVLSEFTYKYYEVYYCLPNVLRSNYKWWIDPVLISFRDFNAIFDEDEEE